MRHSSALALSVLALVGPARGAELFVAGQESQHVLAFDAGTGSFAGVFADTVVAGFSNPGGIALRPSDGALFVSSRSTGEIWRYDTASGAVVTPAAKTGLASPSGLAFSASGATLYFSDESTVDSESADAVKQLELSSGTVTPIGSTADAEFSAVAVNGSDVFAVDSDGDRVVRFPAAGGAGTIVIGTGLHGPSDLVFRSATRLLIADTGTDRVLEYVNSGGAWIFDRVVVSGSAGVGDPCALAIAPSGALTVAGCASNDVVLVDLATLAITPLVAPGSGGLANPKDLVWSASTLLLVANPIANAIVYYDASGQPTGTRAQGLTPPLDAGFALSGDELRLAAASSAADVVIEFDTDTGLPLRRFGGVCAGLFASDVAYGPDGDLFVSCSGASNVNRVDAATGAVDPFVFGGTGGLFAPHSLGFGPNGNLFVSSASGELLEFDGLTGSFLGAFVDASGNGGGPIDPRGFRFHGGALYVASFFTDSVTVYDDATGAFLATLVASGSGDLDEPTAVAFGPQNDVFVASSGDDSVRRYHAVTGAYLGAFVPPGANGLLAPIDLAVRGLPEPALLGALAAGAALLGALRLRSRA